MNKARLTFGPLEACRPCSNDLADAMGFPLNQAVCEVDHDCSSSHAMHQLDVLKGRLTVLPCAPAHATEATLRRCLTLVKVCLLYHKMGVRNTRCACVRV